MRQSPQDWYDNYAASQHPSVVTGNRGQNERRQSFNQGAHAQNEQDHHPSRGTQGDVSSRSRQPAEQGQIRSGDAEYENVHIYGKGSALCFSADRTRAQNLHTVRIEGASSNGPRDFNWSQKVGLQFTIKELPFVLALIMGWLPKVQFTAHGPNNDKGVSLELQDGPKIFVKVWQKDRGMRSVPIPQSEIFQIADLLIKQMLRNSPHLTSDSLLLMCRSITRGYVAPAGGSPGGAGAYQQGR